MDGDKKALGDACYWLTHMQGDSDFDGMRGAGALAKLAEKEREAWQAHWADLDKTLHRVYDKMQTK